MLNFWGYTCDKIYRKNLTFSFLFRILERNTQKPPLANRMKAHRQDISVIANRRNGYRVLDLSSFPYKFHSIDKQCIRIFRTISILLKLEKYTMRTFLSLYSRSSFTYTCGLLMVFISMIFLNTDTAVAQVESSEEELPSQTENGHWRVGIYFSGYALPNAFHCRFVFDNDCLPFPLLHKSIGYKNWQFISSWIEDEDEDKNEFIFNLDSRYNYHPLKKYRFRPFVFAGISMWYFDRRHKLLYGFNPDHPEGKSITLGHTVGLGIEYNILRLGFTHEVSYYRNFSGCPYKGFICRVSDFKFLGVYFMF